MIYPVLVTVGSRGSSALVGGDCGVDDRLGVCVSVGPLNAQKSL